MALQIFLVNLFFLCAMVNGKPWDAQPGAVANWSETYEIYRTQTQANSKDIQVVFLGDSLTFAWTTTGQPIWSSEYNAKGAYNYGIPGDCTQQFLWRLRNGQFDGLQNQPKLIVLMIGTNNIAGNQPNCEQASADETAVGIQTIVQEIRQQFSQTKILLLGILPRNQGKYADAIAQINSDLMNLVDNNWIHYINMISQFENSHTQQKTELYNIPDTLHLSLAGYQVWYQTMQGLYDALSK